MGAPYIYDITHLRVKDCCHRVTTQLLLVVVVVVVVVIVIIVVTKIKFPELKREMFMAIGISQ
jgi:hypothetical protein